MHFMTDANLNRIETQLGIVLPEAYCEMMCTRAQELRGLTYKVQGVTYGWFDDLL